MKGAVEILNEVHQATKDHPDFSETLTVNDNVLVAAIAEISRRLEHLNQSKQDKISPAKLQAMSNELTRGALGAKVSRVLSSAAANGNEKDVALKIHQFLEAL
ncbi:MAG TPA: hypothetical protein VK829_06930 [Terriglobales bacterium]|jgi:hypothetical protein|nr:hypothetical protein [Terriglobales bacterium]